jgi:hypothetical protein
VKLVFDSALLEDGLRVEIAHPVVRPDNLAAYLLELLRRGAPSAPAEVLSNATVFVTRLGWSGKLASYRNALAARYQMFHFVAGVLIVADSVEILTSAGAAIDELVLSARPDFSDEHACIASLWR